jgi:hypothetical protein
MSGIPVDEDMIGAAHAAGGDGDADVVARRRRRFDFGERQRLAGRGDVYCSVRWHAKPYRRGGGPRRERCEATQ